MHEYNINIKYNAVFFKKITLCFYSYKENVQSPSLLLNLGLSCIEESFEKQLVANKKNYVKIE